MGIGRGDRRAKPETSTHSIAPPLGFYSALDVFGAFEVRVRSPTSVLQYPATELQLNQSGS